MVAGTTNYQDPKNQYSHVEDLTLPPNYNRNNPLGHDIVILRLKQGFKLDECHIRQNLSILGRASWTRRRVWIGWIHLKRGLALQGYIILVIVESQGRRIILKKFL